MKTEILKMLQALVAAGASLYFYDGREPVLVLGAAEWIEGRGLLIAELGAEHQGQVHLIACETLEPDGPDLDLVGPDLDPPILMATIIGPEIGILPPPPIWAGRLQTAAWKDFWSAEIANAKQGAT